MNLTPIQQCIFQTLSDGLPHTPEELFGCLDGEYTERNTVQRHISAIRAAIAQRGLQIRCVVGAGPTAYLLSPILRPSDMAEFYQPSP